MTTAAEAMVTATSRLRAAGVDDPARDARVLLAHAARVEAARVTLIAPEDLSPDIEERFDKLISLRAVRVPVSHLVGERAFYGRKFKISSEVLDPRPETETLIEAALSEPFSNILDLGVGSGCILVTLLAEQTEARGVGVDISELACLQASANAVLHSVADRAKILQSNWFENVTGRFDLIISNPPYITKSELETLSDEVRLHEPPLALTDGGDGLSCFREIAAQACEYLTPNGRLIVEFGANQASDVVAIFEAAGLGDVRVLRDLDQRERALVTRIVPK